MADNGDFKTGGSPWGSPSGGGGNGSGRGPTPPNIDEIVKKIQDAINKFLPGGSKSGKRPIIFTFNLSNILIPLFTSSRAIS